MKKFCLVILCCLVSLPYVRSQEVPYLYPSIPTCQAKDNFFGTEVLDPFRCLEQVHSFTTQTWLEKQIELSADYGKRMKNDEFYERAIFNLDFNYYKRYDDVKRRKTDYVKRIFQTYWSYFKPPKLYYAETNNKYPRLILDPHTLRKNKEEVVRVSGWKRSKNERYLAISIERSGSQWQELMVYDMEFRVMLPEIIPQVRSSEIAWYGDEGFYYQSYPMPGAEGQESSTKLRLKYHKVRTSPEEDKDIYKTSNPDPRALIEFSSLKNMEYLFVQDVVEIKGRAYRFIARTSLDPNDNYSPIPIVMVPESDNLIINLVPHEEKGNHVYILTNYGAPNFRVLKHDVKTTNEGKEFIPELDVPLIKVYPLTQYNIGIYLKDGQQQCVVYDHEGKFKVNVKVPPGFNASWFHLYSEDKAEIRYVLNGFYFLPVTCVLDMVTLRTKQGQISYSEYDVSEYQTELVYYPSKDGTQIPMYITHKKNLKKNGKKPVILHAYGGFNVTQSPFFDPSYMYFMKEGGILAVPGLRGGGEKGTDWYDQGKLLNKQKAIDDYIYAAKYLIQEKYTNPDKIVAQGEFNGAMLVTATMVQEPDLFEVVVAEGGVYDMMRYQEHNLGFAWEKEYGSVKIKEQALNLLTYSPYHNVKDRVEYPSTLIVMGKNDDFVSPGHSYKMLAALQKSQKSKNPYILYCKEKVGNEDSPILNDDYEKEAFIYQFIKKNLRKD